MYTFSTWFCASVEEEGAVFDKVAGNVEKLFDLVRHCEMGIDKTATWSYSVLGLGFKNCI